VKWSWVKRSDVNWRDLREFEFILKSSELKWSEVKCSDVNWRDLCEVEFIFKLSEVKWIRVKCGDVNWRDLREVEFILKFEQSYGEVLGDKTAMYIRVTLYWGYLVILWLVHLGVSWTVGFVTCTAIVLNCFVMCGSFCNMCNCIYCVLFCLYCVCCIVCFVYIFCYLFCLYWCKEFCHGVTTKLQLIIIIIIGCRRHRCFFNFRFFPA
jgi:hypothetical protein